jgi:hypothetical protein
MTHLAAEAVFRHMGFPRPSLGINALELGHQTGLETFLGAVQRPAN